MSPLAGSAMNSMERISPEAGAISLARLMERQLCYPVGAIDSVALRLFIQAYWSRVSTYAHAIHEGRERADIEQADTANKAAMGDRPPLCPVCGGIRIHCIHGQSDRNKFPI